MGSNKEKTPAEDNKEKIDDLVDQLGGEEGVKDAPDQVKAELASRELQDDALNPDDKVTLLDDKAKFGDVQNDKAAHGADEGKVHIAGADPTINVEGDLNILDGGFASLGDDLSAEEDQGFTVHDEIPAEDVEFEPGEDVRATLHGSHSAAMSGLQTDASGTYVPPGLVDKDDLAGSTFKQQ